MSATPAARASDCGARRAPAITAPVGGVCSSAATRASAMIAP